MLGTSRGFQAFERTDGQILLVPSSAVMSRQPAEDPPAITPEKMTELLQKRFGEELVRTEIDSPFVIGLVLSSPIEKAAETRATAFLRKAARFMKNVDSVFLRYARSMDFPLQQPRFPMVLLIFESDKDFDNYATEATGGSGLTAQMIVGFYSGLTNWLAVRMTACDTFEVPLHEAIHQQMYNRVFQRFAPIPKWFDEGIATGFENAGDRIDVYPARVNSRYARQFLARHGEVDWGTLIADDSAFTADVLAGDAYTHAWCMHWMLCTQHKDAYETYVAELATRKPFEDLNQGERVQRFEDAFGVSIAKIQGDFPRALEANIKRQKINLQAGLPQVGRSIQQQELGSAEISATSINGGPLQVQGGIRNISPIRSLCFYITVTDSTGSYADWMVSDLKPGQTRPLPRQMVVKPSPGLGGPPGTFRVRIRSRPADSPEAASWKSGQVPGPE